jgi:hypothetical protein
MIVGGWPQDTDASVIQATLKAIMQKTGWPTAELEKPTVAGRFAACGKLHWNSRNSLMLKMVEYKGNHKVDIGEADKNGDMQVRPGAYWFDIDNPKVEREFKRKVATALRSLRAAFLEKGGSTELESRKKFDADYGKGTLFFREAASNRAMRFVEYRHDVVSNRWAFSCPMPAALDTVLPGYDLGGLVADLNA